VNAFERVTFQKIHLKMAPRRAGDLPAYYALPAKARELLGWKAKRTIDEMCLSAWRWEKSRNQ
jgi:UDP-glucose 4-epimerase